MIERLQPGGVSWPHTFLEEQLNEKEFEGTKILKCSICFAQVSLMVILFSPREVLANDGRKSR
jgi:hypothetical protein